ncbi:hypothetical protein GCM10009868_15550 [Terrabacter aerolatus]|uniref:Fibronectin type-III domain-containing protein n=1 Tax=Terrabacter aerolatus TaxID=422442 RepID=A0A512D3V3_9MICO|nr:fibronectin type III domain-containing protein [Terrabacter aerolatus]GEO31143.1 hypothetical protein TAE01_29530 [Terrabacter aerolatus]
MLALSVGLTAVVAAGPATASTVATPSATTLQTVAAAPSVPLHATAVLTGPGQVKVTWTAPSSAGSSPITGYSVTYSTGQSGGGQGVSSTARTAVFNGLQTGSTTYTFSVWATNAAGDGPRVTFPLSVVAVPTSRPTQTVSRTTATGGDHLTISGRGNPGARLTIERALPGQAYKTIAAVKVDAAGHYADTITVLRTATYRTRGATGLLSRTNTVVVHNRMVFTAVRDGFRTYTLGGQTLPAVKGQRVKLYNKNVNGTYSLLAIVLTDQYGRWSFTHRYNFTRTYTFKAVSVATPFNASAAALLSVRVH